jgi:hypothetical protein
MRLINWLRCGTFLPHSVCTYIFSAHHRPQATPGSQPEFTLTAVLLGLAIGCVICFTNLSLGLQSGWISMCVSRFLFYCSPSSRSSSGQDVDSVGPHRLSHLSSVANSPHASRNNRRPNDCSCNGDDAPCCRVCGNSSCVKPTQ